MPIRMITEGDPSKRYALQVRDFTTAEEQRQAIVIRYLTLEKFLSLLEFGAMWFSRLGALQDKYEGTLPNRVRDLSKARDRKIAEMFPEPLLRPAILKMTDQAIEECRSFTAVNCWFLGQNEKEEMWQNYGEQGRGVAIRSTVWRLSTSFQITGDYADSTQVGRAHYIDFDTHEMPVEDYETVNAKAFLKHKDFSVEEEVRIMTNNFLHSGCLNPDGSQATKPYPVDPNRKGFYVKCRLTELVEAVIVGPNVQPHFHTLIKKLIVRYCLCATVEKSRLAPLS